MRRITIRAVPNASKDEIIEEEGFFKVRIKAKAIDGKANAAVLKVLADHFGVKKNQVRLIWGEKSRDKIIEIDVL